MTFRIYRRHNREKCDSKNPYDPRCGCPLSVQFVWKNGDAVFEGKKLTYQNKWSLGTRSWSEAQSKKKGLEERLKDFAEGKVVPKGMTVEAALQEWYEFRDQDGLDNTKAKLMGGKLIEWCENNNTLLLTALTTDKIIKWRLTLFAGAEGRLPNEGLGGHLPGAAVAHRDGGDIANLMHSDRLVLGEGLVDPADLFAAIVEGFHCFPLC